MGVRSNKAKRDKDSILSDAKNLLKVLHPALQNMDKIERIEGAPNRMKMAGYQMIHNFTIAKECPEVRLERIHEMFGDFGEILAAFELCISFGLLKARTDRKRLVALRDMIGEEWWGYLGWNNERLCLGYREGYSINDRLNRKYNLKLKHYGTRDKKRKTFTEAQP